MGHDEYTHFYQAQACYFIGEDGWQKMFPNSPANEKVTWRRLSARHVRHA
ncbi:MAG: hypothetical protein U0744_11440 [Gemmataceae bacterium]